eukprot:4595245-Lingulodinium_polyedra.AAC.1
MTERAARRWNGGRVVCPRCGLEAEDAELVISILVPWRGRGFEVGVARFRQGDSTLRAQERVWLARGAIVC